MFGRPAHESFASYGSSRDEDARHVCFATNERVLDLARATRERENARERLLSMDAFLFPTNHTKTTTKYHLESSDLITLSR